VRILYGLQLFHWNLTIWNRKTSCIHDIFVKIVFIKAVPRVTTPWPIIILLRSRQWWDHVLGGWVGGCESWDHCQGARRDHLGALHWRKVECSDRKVRVIIKGEKSSVLQSQVKIGNWKNTWEQGGLDPRLHWLLVSHLRSPPLVSPDVCFSLLLIK